MNTVRKVYEGISKKKKLKAIAFYLPQYHQIPENDEWWGKGFTDWRAVKDAVPLFDGHQQPRVPLKGYYDLLSVKTMQWQAELAKKADIYGFCFYHYWFKDGRRILEKPAELLLENKQIDMKYCFSWANDPWIRTWSKINGNVWADKYDEGKTVRGPDVLLEQDYGKEREWKEHFEYLYPFFADDRYIKIDGMPVFIIYAPNMIPRLPHMLRCWRQYAKEKGMKGLYVIGTLHRADDNIHRLLDAELTHNPLCVMNSVEPGCYEGIKYYDYDKAWKRYLSFEQLYPRKRYLCGLVGHDTTPRKGERGVVFKGMTPYKFYKYFHRLVKLSRKSENEFIFINAWNEWGETMYLEPDTEYGYACLHAVKKALQ